MFCPPPRANKVYAKSLKQALPHVKLCSQILKEAPFQWIHINRHKIAGGFIAAEEETILPCLGCHLPTDPL